MEGTLRVLLALAATAGMTAFWITALLIVPMIVAVYVCRLIPQSSWRWRR
jgi:hypothetical protein